METEQPTRKLLYKLQIPVRWSDMDVNAHVNNVVFFTYMEQARIEWLKSVEMQNTAEGEGPVVVQTSCNYIRQMPYPETVEVRVYGAAPGRTSFPTYYEIFGTVHSGVKYADGQAIMVWTKRKEAKSLPVPETLRRLLTP